MTVSTERTCKDCGETKEIEQFHKNATTGYHGHRCLSCHVVVNRERRKAQKKKMPREKLLEEKRLNTKRRAEKEGRVYISAAERKSMALEAATDKLAERNAYQAFDWWIRHKASDEIVSQFFLDEPWKNPRLSEAEQWRIRYRLDNEFNAREKVRLAIKKGRKRERLSETMRKAIYEGRESRAITTLLPYSISELCEHLESLFTDGMDWEAFRRGDIHIDHVKPKSLFDLSDPQQFLDCWALSNLQPLWAADNIAKGAKHAA